MVRNCEDIAMSFLVANATGAPPVWVTGTLGLLFNLLYFVFSYCCYQRMIVFLVQKYIHQHVNFEFESG